MPHRLRLFSWKKKQETKEKKPFGFFFYLLLMTIKRCEHSGRRRSFGQVIGVDGSVLVQSRNFKWRNLPRNIWRSGTANRQCYIVSLVFAFIFRCDEIDTGRNLKSPITFRLLLLSPSLSQSYLFANAFCWACSRFFSASAIGSWFDAPKTSFGNNSPRSLCIAVLMIVWWLLKEQNKEWTE